MADSTLQARPALDNYSFERPGFTVNEMPDAALFSIGFSMNDADYAARILSEHLALTPPTIGNSATATIAGVETSTCLLLGLQQDQYWLLSQDNHRDVVSNIKPLMQPPLCLTDQSDAWVLLEMSGKNCLAVLERLCPIDLNENEFQVGKVARTNLEHMNAIIIRTEPMRFLILTARSSARSFVHAVEHTAMHVDNEKLHAG